MKASDRKYQIWERNALSVALWNQGVFKYKLNYIQANPVVAGICQFPEEYIHRQPFYEKGISKWDFCLSGVIIAKLSV